MTQNILLPENWESELEEALMLLQEDEHWQKDYFASPCKADTTEKTFQNMKAARMYLYYGMKHLNANPWAPHAYLPLLLRDNVFEERQLAMQFGKVLLEKSAALHLCGNKITQGMSEELIWALYLNKPVVVYQKRMFNSVLTYAQSEDKERLVRFDDSHPYLARSPEKLCQLEVRYA